MAFIPVAIIRLLALKVPARLHCAIYEQLQCLGICARKPTKRGSKGADQNRRIPVWVTGSLQQSADRQGSAGANLRNIVPLPPAPDPHPISVLTGHRPSPVQSAPGISPAHLRPLPRSSQSPRQRDFCMGLLNARSAKQQDAKVDKPSEIRDLIVDKGFHVLVLTETWFRPGSLDSVVMGEMTPSGYCTAPTSPKSSWRRSRVSASVIHQSCKP
jgi:hypothetical protein